jgi:hypothetical protein
MALPTKARAGLAAIPSTIGQTFSVPSMRTEPCLRGSRQRTCSATIVVPPALTAKLAEPVQAGPPSPTAPLTTTV